MIGTVAYLDGHFIPREEARLNIHDAGFVFGATVTDLCRTIRHQLFRLGDHLRRFRRSCELAYVPLLLSDDELTEIAEELIYRNVAMLEPNDDLALVLFATPGPLPHYAGATGAAETAPTLGLHTFPLPFARFRRLFEQGARVVIPSIRAIPATCIDPNIKQRSRLHWWRAEQQIHQSDPLASALLLDREGNITETAAANILLVSHGKVISPPKESILPGISLEYVRELCHELRIPFVEQLLTMEDCRQAEEAMLTNTSYCLAGISHLDGRDLPWPGPITQRLIKAWSDQVGLDIVGQILSAP